jgi:hypothetical protein
MCWPSCGYNGLLGIHSYQTSGTMISMLISGITPQLSYMSLSGNMTINVNLVITSHQMTYTNKNIRQISSNFLPCRNQCT